MVEKPALGREHAGMREMISLFLSRSLSLSLSLSISLALSLSLYHSRARSLSRSLFLAKAWWNERDRDPPRTASSGIDRLCHVSLSLAKAGRSHARVEAGVANSQFPLKGSGFSSVEIALLNEFTPSNTLAWNGRDAYPPRTASSGIDRLCHVDCHPARAI